MTTLFARYGDDTELAVTLDQSPVWDLAAPPSELGFEFNQALGR
jgi:hypothetical protein